MTTQVVDLGEYKIIIEHDETRETGHLIVKVLDELDGPIETIEIANDEDE